MTTLKDMGWNGFSNAIMAEAYKRCVPTSGTFELTPLCNFRCRMCYVRLDASEISRYGRLYSAEEWLDLAQQAIKMGTYRITLTGGEVLTRPDFKEIYSGLVELGLIVSVLSNGALISEDIVRLFQTYKPARLRFTLYGASNETYERLCGDSRGFDKVMHGLRLLKDGGVPFSLAFTETTENVGDIDAVFDIADSLDVNVVISSNLFPAVRGAKSEAAELTVSHEKLPSVNHPIDNSRQETPEDIFGKGQVPKELNSGLFAHCRSYRTTFFVEWNGQMDTCAYMTSSGARPFETGFETAWKTMHENLAKLRMPEECLSCQAYGRCPICPGRREAETGKPDGIPRRLCEEIRSRLTVDMDNH